MPHTNLGDLLTETDSPSVPEMAGAVTHNHGSNYHPGFVRVARHQNGRYYPEIRGYTYMPFLIHQGLGRSLIAAHHLCRTQNLVGRKNHSQFFL